MVFFDASAVVKWFVAEERASDAIQLGSCLVLQEQLQRPVQFLAFDQRLNDAAVGEGLRLAL